MPRALATETRRAARTSVILSPERETYPRFLRDGESLVKVAWSKKKRKPYEHRAPKAILEELLAAIRKRKGEGKLFEAAHVLPLPNGNGEEYPSCQPYLALTWLRQVGRIATRGRTGYVLKPGAATSENIEHLWTSLGAAESGHRNRSGPTEERAPCRIFSYCRNFWAPNQKSRFSIF